MLVLFSAAANFPVPTWPVNVQQVRAAAEPVLNAWAARLLPNPAKVHCRADYVDRSAGTVVGSTEVLLSDLRLSPLEVVYMTHGQGPQRAELEERLIYHVFTTRKVPANADIHLSYARDPRLPADSFSFGEVVEVAQTVRKLFAGCRPIDGRDLAGAGETSDSGIRLDELSNRATAAEQAMNNALAGLHASLATVRNSPGAGLDGLRNSLLQAGAFGIVGAIPVLGASDGVQARTDLIAQGESVAKEMDARLQRISKLAPPTTGSTPDSQRDYELERLHQLFGAEFRVIFWVAPQNAATLKQTFAASPSLQGGNPLEAVTWFERAACVRAGMARMQAATQYGEAIGSGATLALDVGQLPYRGGDRWAALKGAVSPGLLSLVVHAPLAPALSFDQPIAGLMIDEWNEMVPKTSEVTGITFHFDQPNACAPQAMLLAVAPDDRPVWDLEVLQSILLDTLALARSRAFVADGRVEVNWLDGRIPRGAQTGGDGEGWQWILHDPTPLSGKPAHTSGPQAGMHQHFFYGAAETLKLGVGDSLFAYAYLDSTNPPRQAMLQWRTSDGSFEHRAYWGENLISWGHDNTPSRHKMGGLPPLGQWVRLEVPAVVVGLEGQEIDGAAFSLYDGRAAWDRAGKIQAPASAEIASEHNEIVWLGDRPPQGATLHGDADSWQWVSRNPAPQDGSFVHQSSFSGGVHQHFFVVQKETVWMDSQFPAGATSGADGAGESWRWVSQNPAPLLGRLAHQSALVAGEHQHFFYGASATMHVAPGDDLFAFVFLDANNPPREIMLQWRTGDGSFEHRAYWGEDLIAFGTSGTPSRCFRGPLPGPGQWVRLEVPARLVGLENTDVNGMAFALYDGRATWDRAGKSVQGVTLNVAKGDVLYADVYLDDTNPPTEVMLQWNDGNWEHRAYWRTEGSTGIPWGIEGTPSRYFIGKLPPSGQWARLQAPAALVGLEGREVQGMSFVLANGRATWGKAGVLSAPLMPALIYAPGVI
jgi:hypothetical protein